MSKKVTIRQLPTGVAGLDELLGGGIPEFSFNLIAGTPGSGKTTLAHQIMFSLASPERRALFFTVLGEPPLKMLRYQQQFSYFDIDKINTSIKFINLASDLLDGQFERVLARIIEEVESFGPSLVFVDSFRSMVQSAKSVREDGAGGLQHFIQMLGVQMTGWQATTFLIGEYLTQEEESSPVFTVADGIIWMLQDVHRDAMMRKLQVIKMRGQAQRPGLHTFRINSGGIEVFPGAILSYENSRRSKVMVNLRLTMGVPALDVMMSGGLPTGYSLLVVGPSGCGKSMLSTEFLAEGARLGEPGVIAAFEKSPSQLLNGRLKSMVDAGSLSVIDTQTLDLSIDEILHDLMTLIRKKKAKRVVIDSLSGLSWRWRRPFARTFVSPCTGWFQCLPTWA